jgi:hypothetical protein
MITPTMARFVWRSTDGTRVCSAERAGGEKGRSEMKEVKIDERMSGYAGPSVVDGEVGGSTRFMIDYRPADNQRCRTAMKGWREAGSPSRRAAGNRYPSHVGRARRGRQPTCAQMLWRQDAPEGSRHRRPCCVRARRERSARSCGSTTRLHHRRRV